MPVLNNNYATWLPFSGTQPHTRHLMILRNMLEFRSELRSGHGFERDRSM